MAKLQPHIVNLIRRKCTIKIYSKLVEDAIELTKNEDPIETISLSSG